jgi:cytochrome c-type biogenesis protein CcmH/NrfF
MRCCRARNALLLVLVAALVAVAPAMASEQHPTLSEMEAEIMCPVCHEPLNMSDSAVSKRIEAYIAVRIRAGDTKSEIKRKLVAQFGPAILANSPDRAAWTLPLVGAAAAILVLAFAAWRWRRRGDPPEEPLDPELDARVDEALARYDA